MDKIWFIHGTYSDHTMWKMSKIRPFISLISNRFNAVPDTNFNWGKSNNTDNKRRAAANLLAKEIRKWRENNPSGKIILLGHSHGGNVIILAANILGDSRNGKVVNIDNIITVSTPVREYRLKYKNVRIHNHVYSNLDLVQLNGGKAISLNNKKKKKYFEAGLLLERSFPGANNIKIPFWGYPNWWVTGNPVGRVYKGVQSHGEMMENIKIWRKYVTHKIKK